MKKILFLLGIIFLVSCGKYVLVTNKANTEVVILSKNTPGYIVSADGSPKPNVKELIVDQDGKIFPCQVVYFEEYMGFYYYKINLNNNDYYVTSPYALSVEDFDMLKFDNELEVSKEISDVAWGRALRFIMKHSTMKIQSQSDLMIETYNPISAGGVGFSINRIKGSANDLYSIECKVNPEPPLNSIDKVVAKEILYKSRLAHYIKTGKGLDGERKDLIYYLEYGKILK